MTYFYGQYIGFGAGGAEEGFSFGGASYGFVSAGMPSSTRINKFSFASGSEDAIDHGDIVSRGNNRFGTGASSKTHGYSLAGNGTSGSNVISKYTFAGSGVSGADVGDLQSIAYDLCGSSSDFGNGYGFAFGGGYPFHKTIDRFSFVSDGNSTDWEDLSESRVGLTGHTTETHGYASGGHNGPATNFIDRFPFASQTTASDIGDLTRNTYVHAGASSATHGYSAGGSSYPSGDNNVIDKFTFESTSTITDIGDLLTAEKHVCGVSSIDYGYSCGGLGPSDVIERWSFATGTQDSSDVGNLVSAQDGPMGCQV